NISEDDNQERKVCDLSPPDEADLAPHEIAAAAIDMERILEQEPQLSDFGFGLSDSHKTHEDPRDWPPSAKILLPPPMVLASLSELNRPYPSRGRRQCIAIQTIQNRWQVTSERYARDVWGLLRLN